MLSDIVKNLPEVKGPIEKRLSFNVRLKWTLIILITFFILANISLFGLAQNAMSRFDYLAVILGTDFGSIISLGIGPIVMASIILQLLVGSKILNIDTSTEEGKRFFQGLQKLLVLFFIVFEAIIYVLMKGLQAVPGYTGIMIFQLILGGLAIMFMDEVVNKWGFGHGISLFIVAGVGRRLFTSLFQFIGTEGGNCLLQFSGPNALSCSGQVLVLIQSMINQNPVGAALAGMVIGFTALIFALVVWAQSLKVEVPLSFDRLRGYGIRWPLSFFYASVIPVILVAALAANIQLVGGLLNNAAEPCFADGISAESCAGMAKFAYNLRFLGTFSNGQPISGVSYWIGSTPILQNLIKGSLMKISLLQGLAHILFYMVFSTIFAVFWVKTSGMDARSQAKNILASGLQIPGFRKDERVLESVLNRYVMPLTIMGGAAIGLLAAGADLLGALVSGTSILLAVMIIFQYYQTISQQHAMDMHPAMKKFMG